MNTKQMNQILAAPVAAKVFNVADKVKSKTEGTTFKNTLESAYRKTTDSMEQMFSDASRATGVPVSLLKAVAKAESDFNPKATSKSGAMGVMQLMPSTAKSLGVANAYDARSNIMGGAKYLKENLERYKGNVQLALAAYNAGPNNVDKYNGIPPFQETQNYVKKVTGFMKENLSTERQTTALAGQNSAGLFAAAQNGINESYLANQETETNSIFNSWNMGLGTGLNTGYGSLLSSYGMLSPYGNSYGNTFSQYASGLNPSYGNAGMPGMFGQSAVVSEDGQTVTLNKTDYLYLVEMLKMQMQMQMFSLGGMNSFGGSSMI